MFDEKTNAFLDNLVKGASNEELFKMERMPASKPFVGPPEEVIGVKTQPETTIVGTKPMALETAKPAQVAQGADYQSNVNRGIEKASALNQAFQQERQLSAEDMDKYKADISSAYLNLTKSMKPRERTPEEAQRIIDANKSLSGIQEIPERNLLSEAILAFTPAAFGLLGGESAKIAQLEGGKNARKLYEDSRKQDIENINKRNETIKKNYENILKIDKDAAEQYLNNQKLQLQQADTAFKAASTVGTMTQKDVQKYDDKIADLTKAELAATQKGAEKLADIEMTPAEQAAKTKRAGIIASGQGFKEETSLRKEINDLKEVKDLKTIEVAYKKMRSAVNNPSPAGDMSIVFGAYNAWDPSSTVREGEYDRALKATGLPTQLRNALNKLKNGEILSPEQRKDFLEQARNSYNAQLEVAGRAQDDYTNIAGKRGLDVKNVVPNKTQPIQKELSGVDKQALDWAKKNSKDPRAQKILQKLGVK